LETTEAGRLDKIKLLADLPPDAIREIETRCKWQRYAPGDVIFDENSESLDVYFLVEGSVRILRRGQDAREVSLANFVAGDFFGELAAIDGKPRSARVVVADESTILAALDGPTLLDAMTRHPQIALKMLKRFAAIIRALDGRVTALSTLGESERIYGELIKLARPDPRRQGYWVIPEMPKHQDLAGWVGTSREVVAQVIGELARVGVVDRKHMSLIIRDWNKLQLMARIARH
jgi:CRP-like cAMP-binding protein